MTDLPRNDLDRVAILNAIDRRHGELAKLPGGWIGARAVLLAKLRPRDTVRAAAPGAGRGGSGPADPVAAAVVDPTRVQAQLLDWDRRLVAVLGQLADLAAETGQVLHEAAATRAEPPRQLERKTCRSCRRVPSTTDPTKPYEVDIDPDRYADLCRWCGDFRGATGRIPPRGVVEARRDGRRVTSRVIEQALAAERAS